MPPKAEETHNSQLDLTALAHSLGELLRGHPTEEAVEVLHIFTEQGLSARAAARESGIGEHLVRLWVNRLGLKRSGREIQMQRQSLRMARQTHRDHMAEAAEVRRGLVDPSWPAWLSPQSTARPS